MSECEHLWYPEGGDPHKMKCISCGTYIYEHRGRLIITKDAEITSLKEENERLVKWVDDLQSGMYINCVYCGHRYGPKDKVPCTMANALKQHIEQCPKHPMSALKKSLAAAGNELDTLRTVVWHLKYGPGGWWLSLPVEKENGLDIAKLQREMGK